MELLTINNVSISYGGQRPVVKKVNLSVKPKEIIAIVGESGSGKSTLIRAVLGLLPIGGKVSAGEIIFKGTNLLEYSKKEWRELLAIE